MSNEILSFLRVACVALVALGWSAPALACSHKHTPLCPGDETIDKGQIFNYNYSGLIEDAWTAVKEADLEAFDAGVKLINTTWDTVMDTLGDNWSAAISTKMASSSITDVLIPVKAIDAQIRADGEDHAASLGMQAAMESGVNAGGADQLLCNRIRIEQAIPAMQDFARMIMLLVARGIDATYMGQGDGPRYWADQLKFPCGLVEEYETKTGNTDMPAQCRAPIEIPELSMADKDIVAMILDRDAVFVVPAVKEEVYEHKDGTKQTVLMFKAEAEDEATVEAMKRWMIATQFCYTAAGMRLPPAYGAGLFTPAGMPKNDKYKKCRTRQFIFNEVCTYRLGTRTRPNCEDDTMESFCTAGMEACAAGKTANLGLGPAYQNCTHGLSLYQIENVSVKLCGSSRRLESNKLGGTQSAEDLQVLADCKDNNDEWEARLNVEDQAFLNALAGLSEVEECFREAGAQ